MRIRCPYCGERGLAEFTYRGDATLIRPESLDASAEPAWVDYVYLRENPAGLHREYWFHSSCHSWLVITREVRSHEIRTVRFAREMTAMSHPEPAVKASS